MADLAALIAWRDALKHRRFTGERAIEYDGKRVEFKSDQEMAEAIAALDRDIAALSKTPVGAVRLLPSKGL